jgi:glycosyltransferase involved in cell wall biosynthesis
MPQFEREPVLDQRSTHSFAVSVVIPAWNEEREIERCLESLSRQTYTDFEVIVVDNGSTDATASLAKAWGARVIEESRRGISCARQAGFETARGSIVASTDADTVVPPNWLARIDETFRERSQTVGVFGPFQYQPHSASNAPANRLIPLCSAGIASAQWLTWKLGRPHFPGSNFAVQRDAFLQVCGFRSPSNASFYSYWEDVQLGLKLNRIGEIRYLSDLVVLASGRKLRSVGRNILYPVRQAAVLHLLGREL